MRRVGRIIGKAVGERRYIPWEEVEGHGYLVGSRRPASQGPDEVWRPPRRIEVGKSVVSNSLQQESLC
jgi:hypothetical protein